MNAILLRSSLAFIASTSLAAQAPPRVHRVVEDVLPPSTYVALQFGGLTACGDASKDLPMAALVGSFLQRLPVEVRTEHLENGLDQAGWQLQQMVQQAGLSPADLRALASRPMTLALGRLSIEGMGPSVALVVEEGESKDAIARCASALMAVLPQGADVLPTSTVEIRGAKVRHLQFPEGPPIFAGSVGGYFVVTNSRGYLGDLVDVVQAKAPSLAVTSRLADLRTRLPLPALASVFVNTAPLVAMFDAHLPYEAADLSAALGIGQLDSIYAGTTATSNGGIDLLHIGVRGAKRGLCKALLAQPADLSFAEVCSKNTVVFAVGSLDAPAVVDAFERFLQVLPAAARAEMQSELMADMGHDLREMGIQPQVLDGMLRAFGSKVGVALSLEKGAVPKPELLVSLQIRDAAAVASMMQGLEAKVAEAAGVEWKTRQVGDDAIRFCNLELPNAPLQVSPCYVLSDTALLCGSDVAALVRALHQTAKPDESLATQDDFRALVADAAGGSGVLHLRLFRAAELGWRTVESWVYPQLDAHADEIGFGSDAFPDAEAMSTALGTSTFVYHVDDEGITVKNCGTLALGSLIAAFGQLGDEVLSRACGKVY